MLTGTGRSLPGKLLRRVRRGDIRTAAYLSYYHSYLLLRDWRLGTHFSGSTKASDLGGSDATSTGNFPCHPRIARHLIDAIPMRSSLTLVDVGCGSGCFLYTALEMGFARVDGIELFPQAAAIARANIHDPRTEIVVGDALTTDLRSYDVMTLFNPFPMVDQYEPLIARNAPHWLLLMNLEAVNPPNYRTVRSYRHPLYAPFTGRLLKRLP